jgi:uncharacterized protein YdbL (DUF1318 family)
MEESKMCLKKVFMIGVCYIAVLLIGKCSVQAPEVRVTGGKTALEREVVGTYHRLEEDTWMIASTRFKRDDEVKISPEKRRVLDALQQQKFNKDDIDEFKIKEFVGESNEGFLVIRDSEQLKNDLEVMKLVKEIVEEENRDRNIIIARVIELNDTLKKAEKKEVYAIFARMHQENSPESTWIQESDGTWVKK